MLRILWPLIICAIMLFWAVGASRRLARLRDAVRAAFAPLDEMLLRQLIWMQGNLPEEIRGEVSSPAVLGDGTTAAWARLHAASEQFGHALAAARANPLDAAATAALVLAHEAMRGAWGSALEQAVPPDATPSPERLQQHWLRLLHQAIPLRAAYNEAAAAYNRAIAQFPAKLLALATRLRPAGMLTRLAETPKA
ncbi:MAG: LemA family protein [Ottowia sp.]|nr:LemA family protein [Ottowia sp.]